jgi:uncharacterized protein (TIGR00255 family)
MIQSMTGFGKATAELQDQSIIIEIRTLNSKNLDLNFRMSSIFKTYELSWRKMVASKLLRGKVDIFLNLENKEDNKAVQLNKSLINSYVKDLQDILPLRGGMDNAKLLEIAMQMPDVMMSKDDEFHNEDLEIIENAMKEALDQVVDFRNQEGRHLKNDFEDNLNQIQSCLENIKKIDQNRIEKVKSRILASLEELPVEYDKNRFEQELIYYIEKYDISEEKTRLKNHIDYFQETLNSEQSQGKKLNFISQEMGREINTIGSKANDAELQNLVVEMKDQLEKIKEQLLNIL